MRREVWRFLRWAALGIASAAIFAPLPLAADEPPRPGQVTLSVKDYLALVEKAEEAERRRALAAADREAPLSEITAQRTSVVVGEDDAAVVSRFTVLIAGAQKAPLLLPLAGAAERALVRPASGAVLGGGAGGPSLAATAPGTYEVEVTGRAALAPSEGRRTLTLAAIEAPVAVVDLDLPADLAWSCPRTVIVSDQVAGDRRKVRLSAGRGAAPVVELRRKADGAEAEKRLVESVVLTIVELRAGGARRHDVVLYEVSRGGLDTLSVDLPSGLVPEQVGTDGGTVIPVVEARHLAVHRERQLRGIGYLALTSIPESPAAISLAPVVPDVPVRARYLAVVAAIAADAAPQPAAAFSRVDLDDLPALLRDAVRAMDLAAVWRLDGNGDGATLAVTALPLAPSLETLVARRETTTLVTVDGTVLHRDLFTLSQAGASLDMTLPAGATLWSAKIGDQPVRPLQNGSQLSVPLGADSAGRASGTLVEVVSVLEKVIPKGRSRLTIDLPQVTSPVLAEEWRLLLPEGASYRFRTGDLRPAPEAAPPPAPPTDAVREEIIVATEAKNERDQKEKDQEAAANLSRLAFRQEAQNLKQGLVGGVQSLPITVPEAGKSLLLTGVMPPPKVSVELEVKAKR